MSIYYGDEAISTLLSIYRSDETIFYLDVNRGEAISTLMSFHYRDEANFYLDINLLPWWNTFYLDVNLLPW